MDKDKELITTNQTFIIPTEEDRIPVEELEGFNIDFEKIKIPSGRNYSI